MEKYFRKVKALVDRLAAAGITLDDKESSLHILYGLPAYYNMFIFFFYFIFKKKTRP